MLNCPPNRKSSAERLFQEFEDVFSRNSSDIGHTTVTQHRIDTADHPPIKQHQDACRLLNRKRSEHYYERCRKMTSYRTVFESVGISNRLGSSGKSIPKIEKKQHSLPAGTMAVQSHAVRALQCASYFRAPDGDRKAKGSDFLKLALFT
ncbi:hypothetical protein TNCV_4277211 [Trichonephila clavipes]|nr:hypothetical protein TNCV_4277211 [Trichonephila clavipes]